MQGAVILKLHRFVAQSVQCGAESGRRDLPSARRAKCFLAPLGVRHHGLHLDAHVRGVGSKLARTQIRPPPGTRSDLRLMSVTTCLQLVDARLQRRDGTLCLGHLRFGSLCVLCVLFGLALSRVRHSGLFVLSGRFDGARLFSFKLGAQCLQCQFVLFTPGELQRLPPATLLRLLERQGGALLVRLHQLGAQGCQVLSESLLLRRCFGTEGFVSPFQTIPALLERLCTFAVQLDFLLRIGQLLLRRGQLSAQIGQRMVQLLLMRCSQLCALLAALQLCLLRLSARRQLHGLQRAFVLLASAAAAK
jgi:hypothetical protein